MKKKYPIFFLYTTITLLLCAITTQAQDSLSRYTIHELDSIFSILDEEEQYQELMPYAEAALAKAEKKVGKKDTLYARMLYNLAYAFDYGLEDFEQAMSHYKETAAIQQASIPTSIQYAHTLQAIADINNYNWGNYEEALPLYTQALNIKKKVLGKERPDFAAELSSLAALHEVMGNYEEALPLYTQATNILEKLLGKEHPHFATSLNNLAALYQSMGNYDKALPLYIQAINILEKVLGKEHPDFATSLNNLAFLHESMSNYDKALPLYIQAINILEKVLGKEHPDFAVLLNNLAYLHQSMGNYDKALPLYIQCMNIDEKELGKEHPDFARSLNNLARLYEIQGNYEKALPLYNQCIEIEEKALGKEHPDFAASLNNLAFLHESMNNYEKALPLYIQCIEIEEKALGKEHPDFAASLNNLARLYTKMEHYDKAKTILIQAIQTTSLSIVSWNINSDWADSLLLAKYPSTPHLDEMEISLNLIYKLLQKDKSISNSKEKQRIVANLAIQLLNKLRHKVSNEKDKLRILESSSTWLEQNLNILNTKEHSSKAFSLADQNKSVLLLQATKSEETYKLSNLPDSLVQKNKKMLGARSQLQAQLVELRPKQEKDSLRNLLNRINQDIDDFVQMIKLKYPKYHKLKYQQVDAKVKDIQALLDNNTALLEYVIGDSIIHIFYIDKTQVQWKKTFVNNDSLNSHINSLHNSLSNYKMISGEKNRSYQEYTHHAHWLHNQLLKPVLTDKTNLNNLIIVTDGELGHLPFETFLVEQAPKQIIDYKSLHYLVKDYNISYNYSATLWKENIEAPTPKNNGQILAMAANYDIKQSPSILKNRLLVDQKMRSILNPLPAAHKEVETLMEKYQGFFAFDTLASEKTVKEKVSDFAVLHFATHGQPDHKNPELSWLAFSEDNDPIENNFWQAHEIAKIQLHANLVVLSACETGYGIFEEGNGIASLARAFMYAGSPALIVSLWQVNDQVTSIIMKNLYANLAEGMKKDEALRQAKLQYMKSAKGIAAHPAFWSPFIMMGNTEPVSIKKKGLDTLPWIIGTGGLLLLVLGGLAIRKYRQKKEVA
ncbi:MAG: tetratricopeptide repeat protein [Aureispira sp.]|nr:tetratricopeptide repeat protein [Aureispira sp.]